MNRHPLPVRPGQPPLVARAVARLWRVLVGLAAAGVLLALIAGVPYGLVHWLGWPLPHRWPTWHETRDTLTGPFTDRIMLDTLACLCWIVWALFLTDIARTLPDTLRDTRHHETGRTAPTSMFAGTDRRAGPLRGLAALLLTAVVAGLLSTRPHPALAARGAAPLDTTRTATVIAALRTDTASDSPPAAASVRAGARTAVVQAPHDGIHDSLWRIAARYLGDGARWPEIYHLNEGIPQADGRRLSSPSLIQPGWTLRLPADAGADTAGTNAPGDAPPTTPPISRPATPAPGSSAPRPSPAPTTSNGASRRPTAPGPSATGPRSGSVNPPQPTGDHGSSASPHPTATAGQRHNSGGLDLGDGVFVSLGLAGAISAAVVTERRRRRRHYVPGSGRRDDLLPIAPVVRSLHLAHLRATGPAPRGDIDDTGSDEPGEAARGDGPSSHDHGSGDPDSDTDDSDGQVPVRNATGRAPHVAAAASTDGGDLATTVAQAVQLAVAGGLGLVGPGADSVLRGLMLELLANPNYPLIPTAPLGVDEDGASGLGSCEVVMPATTAGHVLGRPIARGATWLHVTPDLSAALDQLEAITLHRARHQQDHFGHGGLAPEPSPAPVLLIAQVPPDVGRLQAVLDNGAAVGVGGVLLGQWRSGASLYAAPDGQVSATSPGSPRTLHRRRLPTLTATAAHDVLAALTPRVDSAPSPTRTDPPDAVDADGATAADPRHAELVNRHALDTVAADGPGVDARGRVPPVHEPDRAAPDSTRTLDRSAPTSSVAPAPGDRTQDKVLLRVLGPVQLSWPTTNRADAAAGIAGELANPGIGAVSLGPRQRELLVVLALHPDGIARDRLADTLWPDTPPDRPFNALHTTLNRLRRSLAAASGGGLSEITRADGDRYRLDPQIVETDYGRLRTALATRRAASDDEARAHACRAILAAYTGELGDGVAADWIETPREAVRREVLDAAVTLARHVAASDPQEALDVLETARGLDPYNEQLYRDIMRLQQRLGRASSIGHTLALLTSRLAEIDQTPEPTTAALAQRLANPAPATDQPAPPRSDHEVAARRPVTG